MGYQSLVSGLSLMIIICCICDVHSSTDTRYLLYDVNPGEGFNLRRDVYMRVANMVRMLNDDGHTWILVLPPWGLMFHWRTFERETRIPWSRFFDLESLSKLTPVIELEEWIEITGDPYAEDAWVEEMYYLQPFSEGWVDGKWSERVEKRECGPKATRYSQGADGMYHGPFWDYSKTIFAHKLECVSVQAEYKTFKDFLTKSTTGQSVMIDRAEMLIHGGFSEWSKEWWNARRSMRFSPNLIKIGDEFRETVLNSSDEKDKTVMKEDWREQEYTLGTAEGGPYVATHLRRRDFLYGHAKEVPSLEHAATQLAEILRREQLQTLFVATDGNQSEYQALTSYLSPEFQVHRFKPYYNEGKKLGDGGIAIIDQWICAHARYFIGTRTSTFSFRIHEERSLLGFSPDSTYNRLCGTEEDEDLCSREQPGRWFPKY